MEYIVMDIGGTFIKYARMDEDGHILTQDKIKTPKKDVDEFFETMDQIVQQPLDGIALSFPGPVMEEEGIVLECGSMNYLAKKPLTKMIEERYGVPCTIENDAHCAALAEVWQGNLKDVSVGMIMVFGTGIGSSLVIDGKLYKGAHHFSGEISCIITKDIDELGWNARFSFEVGMPYLLQRVHEAKQMSDELTGEQLFQLLDQGDEVATGIFQTYCKNLAKQIYNFQCMMDPQRVCIGGGVSMQPRFISSIQQALDEFYAKIPMDVPKPEIMPCKFHNDSNLLGALYHHKTLRT